MKENLQEIKKKFDSRCDDYKRQLAEFKKNNEAIEALKKAHAKEIAAHVQEHNNKYSQLLTEKMDSEDALKLKAEKDLAKLSKELTEKQIRAVDEVKR
jgi:hypothetical protein